MARSEYQGGFGRVVASCKRHVSIAHVLGGGGQMQALTQIKPQLRIAAIVCAQLSSDWEISGMLQSADQFLTEYATGPIHKTSGTGRRENIVKKFKEFLEKHPDRPLYLPEICSSIGVAERTLRAACEEHLGMGPIRYLTLRRMHLVRRSLLVADASRTSVTCILTDHGFWELGRFSVAYHAMFGETPSQTLRRRADQTAINLRAIARHAYAG
jgi:transcriptional regulator GlxA family with amidase domain